MIYLDELEELPLAAVGLALCKIVKAFCDYVAQTVSQSPAPPSVEPAFMAPDPPSDPPEALATLIADIAAIHQDSRFQGLPPSVRLALGIARIGQGAIGSGCWAYGMLDAP